MDKQAGLPSAAVTKDVPTKWKSAVTKDVPNEGIVEGEFAGGLVKTSPSKKQQKMAS